MPRAGLSTQAVVEVAVTIVDKSGLQALTLAAVAARAGVASPSLYKHVRSLDALQQKVSALVTGQFAEALSSAAAGRAGQDAVRAVAHAYRDWALAHPERYPATQRVPDPDDPVHLAAGERAVGTMVAILRGYDVAGADAIDATRFVRSALHGFVSLEVSGGFGIPQDVDRSFERLIDGVDVALSRWG